jgi:hypothetical protein
VLVTAESEPLTGHYALALRACDQLLAEARAGEISPGEWTVEELERTREALLTAAMKRT